MKRRLTIIKSLSLILFLCFFVITPISLAHPGRTDENGGHWDKKNGTYHFHTGEYAGRSSSGGSSSKGNYEPFTPPYDPPTTNPYKQKSKESKATATLTEKIFSPLGFVAIPISLLYLFIITSIIYELICDVVGTIQKKLKKKKDK